MDAATLKAFCAAYGCDADDSWAMEAIGLTDALAGDPRLPAAVALLSKGELTEARVLADARPLGLDCYRTKSGVLVTDDGTVVGGVQAYALKDGVLIRIGHREECESAAMDAGGDYGWIDRGCMLHRRSFGEDSNG